MVVSVQETTPTATRPEQIEKIPNPANRRLSEIPNLKTDTLG
jgi:hypothetical protein